MKGIRVDDGTIEGLKWLALVLMALDHINKYVFHEQFMPLFNAGRVCMPLFALILSYNLARDGALTNGRYARVLIRLAAYGAIAMPAFWLLGVPFFVLNIMFTLACGVLCIWLMDEGGALNRTIAVFAFLLMSIFVEFWWFGVAIMISGWTFFKRPSAIRAAVLVAAVASLSVVNRNFYALLALPIFWCAQYVSLNVPRLRHVFYGFYPLHLTLILLAELYAF